MRTRAGFWLAGLSLAAGLLATLAAPAARQGPQAQTPPPAEPVDDSPLVAPGDAPDLALIYTGGVVGYVEPCG